MQLQKDEEQKITYLSWRMHNAHWYSLRKRDHIHYSGLFQEPIYLSS